MTTEQPQPTSEATGGASDVERVVHSLPPGWKFEHLHKHCPQCGCDLSKEFIAHEQQETFKFFGGFDERQ